MVCWPIAHAAGSAGPTRSDTLTPADTDPPGASPAARLTVWAECLRLAGHLRDYAWAAPVMLLLGLGAALAETLGISLAVIFLFTILGATDQFANGDGLLASAFHRITEVLGTDPVLIAAGVVLLILLNAMMIYAYQVLTAVLMNRIAERMRDLVHERYVTVGYRWLQNVERGALVHTLSTETWDVSTAFESGVRICVALSAVTVFGAGLLLLSWQIGLTAILCAGATFALMRLLARPIRRYSDRMLDENRFLSERMLVCLNGMRTLRVFAQEPYALKVFGGASRRVRQLAIRTERIKALIGPLREVAGLVTLVIIGTVATWLRIDTATTVAAVLLLFRLQPHLREVDTHRLVLADLSAAMRSVRETLDPAGKPVPPDGHRVFDGLRGAIRFEGVTFRHDPRRGDSLHDVSFTLGAGTFTALEGPSGSGKTTIINLLLRLYEPDAGRITVDDTDLRELTRESWLGAVSVAGQDVELVEGTVAQNIRLAAHDATDDDLREACRIAGILDDVQDMPDGLDARIGPGGLSLSGGQRQRLGLARALIRKPDILILDEALNALEPALEDRILARIETMMAGRTILKVSHRARPASAGDPVIRIDSGRVVAAAPASGG